MTHKERAVEVATETLWRIRSDSRRAPEAIDRHRAAAVVEALADAGFFGENWDPEPEPIMALVTVDEQGRLTPESTVTVGGFTWPVPETYGTVIWLHRVGRTLRDHGWSVTGEPRPGAEAGLYEVPVRKIETNET